MRQVDQKPIRAREGHHTMKRSLAVVAALLYALVAGYSSAQARLCHSSADVSARTAAPA
jgi:two-component sensor histidine kinase